MRSVVNLYKCYPLTEKDSIEFSTEFHSFMKNAFEKFIDQFEAELDLDLTGLESVTFAQDYNKELKAFQEQHGLPVGFTSNELGTGEGMTLWYFTEGIRKSAIFLTPEIFLGLYYLFQKDSEIVARMSDADKRISEFGALISQNTFLHELAHVSEMNLKFKSNIIEILGGKDDYDKTLLAVAMDIWEEYYVYRKSADAFTIVQNPQDLEDTIQWLDQQIYKHVKECKFFLNFDAAKFYSLVKKDTLQLFRTASNLIANAEASSNHKTLIEEASNRIEGTFFDTAFYRLNTLLRKMYEEFPEWGDLTNLMDLAKVFTRVLGQLEVVISKASDGRPRIITTR
jgi:hypothetical protein